MWYAGIAGFDPAAAVWHDGGWDFAVIETDGLMYRFPRRPEAAAALVREAALLPVLASRLPVALPRLRLAGVLEDGTPYGVYPKLPGEPLQTLSSVAAGQLAGVIAALHGVPVREAVELGVTGDPGDWRPAYAGWAARARARVLPLVAPEDRAEAERRLAAPLELAADGAPRLTHGDLHPAHLLGDPARGVLTGVLDWADASLGDPATDLAGVVSAYGREVAEGIEPDLAERAVAWSELEGIWEVLFGLDHGEENHVRAGLARATRSTPTGDPQPGRATPAGDPQPP